MGVCGSKQSKIDLTRLDLDEVFTDYIWKKLYPMDVGPFKAMFTNRRNHTVDIRWEHLEKTSDTEWKTRPQDIDGEPEDKVVVHYADYDNKSGRDQNFTFSAERETTSSASFEFTETYTMGNEGSLEIGIPDVLKIGAGISEETSVQKGNSKTFQSRRLWNVNSNITVDKGLKLKAKLIVVEKKTTSDFVVVNKMRFHGYEENRQRVPYVIKDKRGRVVSVGAVYNLEAPFRKRLPRGCTMVTFKEHGKAMVIRVSGICKIVKWEEQHVKIEPFTAPADPVPNNKDGTRI